MVQSAQLFKRFRQFERSGGPGDKVLEEIRAIAIEANVAERLSGLRIAGVGNGGAGKVEGVVFGIQDHFDYIGILQLCGCLERRSGRDEVDSGVVGQ